MKRAELKNGVRDSTRSILVNAAIDRRNLRFVAIGLLGIVIDLLVFQVLFASGANLEPSQIISFFAGALSNFALNARGGLSRSKHPSSVRGMLYCRFLLVALLVLILRSALLMLLIGNWHWQPQTAIVVAILLATAVFLVGAVFFIYLQSDASEDPAVRWPVITISIVTYVLILKLIFMGCVNLIPEEAYYWNYAQHLDWGYLDHPPMVAWLIWLSTSALGKSELSVRLPAYLCWIIAAIFMFRLTLNLYDKSAAFRTILLLAVLPIYFGLGFFMTPDAPLYAAWAGCLYFLERALIAQNSRAWWGVGMCIGVGMLSKYTVALLGLGTLMFLLIDRQSRRWLFRPEPYIAAIMSVILFSPVFLWNMRNGWVSFAFQGSNRWEGSYDFSLHVLFGTILLLLTPTGVLAIVRVLLPQRLEGASAIQTDNKKRQYLWAVTYTLVPLSVFVIYSLFYQPKLNWTAPIWLAAIPLLAWDMVPPWGQVKGSLAQFSRRLWMPTIIALLFIHGGSFYYISLGLPGAGPMTADRLFGEWQALANSVETVKRKIELKTGSKPVVVGMDKNFISSELSFYAPVDHDGPKNTGGPHFFGNRSLMWAFWFPRSAAIGRNFLMIDLNRKRLMHPSLPQYFGTISDVFEETLKKDGRVVGYFYWRVGYRYRG
jgi:dolichol-phosphate mannosyltransferase